MTAMICRLAGFGLGLVAFVALVTSAGAAPLPEGPRLAFGFWNIKGDRLDLAVRTVGADGGERTTLAGAGRIWPAPFDSGSWSPDGSSFAFSGAPRKMDGKRKNRIYIVPASGGTPLAVPHAVGGREPVFSPDGRTLAFSRTRLKIDINFDHPERSRDYFSTTTWIIDLTSGRSRQLTRWRNGFGVEATSFSPDGRTLLVEREMGNGAEIATIDIATGRVALFAREAADAVYSPDGSMIALVSDRDGVTVEGEEGPIPLSELYVVTADGSRWQRLTRNRMREEEAPSWDPSGQRIAFAQSTGPGTIGFGFNNIIAQVNVNGTCPTRLVGKPRSDYESNTALYAPTWRPGPGREAGPISC
jgi:Tol biopolymer transport system component